MDATIIIEDAKPEWPERYETEKSACAWFSENRA